MNILYKLFYKWISRNQAVRVGQWLQLWKNSHLREDSCREEVYFTFPGRASPLLVNTRARNKWWLPLLKPWLQLLGNKGGSRIWGLKLSRYGGEGVSLKTLFAYFSLGRCPREVFLLASSQACKTFLRAKGTRVWKGGSVFFNSLA